MDEDAKLGDILIRENLITESQLKTALDFQKSLGGGLKEILIKLGFVKDSVLSSLIAEQQHMHTIDISDKEVDAELMEQIPKNILERHQVVPLKSHEGTVLLAMSDPNDYRAIEEIQFLTNRRVETALAPRAAIRKAVNQYYELTAQREAGKATISLSQDRLKTILSMSTDTLIKSIILTLIENGTFTAEEIISRAKKIRE
jgi:type IV pilus assembly protein PilB